MRAALEQAKAAQAAKMDAYACAVAAGKAWPDGKKPVPAERAARVARVRRTSPPRARLDAARQAAATSPGKVPATDPDSRLLPARTAAAGCKAGT